MASIKQPLEMIFASASLGTFQVLPEFLLSRRCLLTGLSTSLQKCWDCMAHCTSWIISGGRIKKQSRLTNDVNDIDEIKFYLKLWLKNYCSSKFNCIPMGSIIPPSFAKCHMQSQPWNVIKSQGQKKTLWECHWRSKSPSDFFFDLFAAEIWFFWWLNISSSTDWSFHDSALALTRNLLPRRHPVQHPRPRHHPSDCHLRRKRSHRPETKKHSESVRWQWL